MQNKNVIYNNASSSYQHYYTRNSISHCIYLKTVQISKSCAKTAKYIIKMRFYIDIKRYWPLKMFKIAITFIDTKIYNYTLTQK